MRANVLRRRFQLPSGYRLEWVGEFGEFQDAIQRLEVIVPLSILLIGVLLYANFGSRHRHAAGRQRHPHGPDRRRIFSLFLTGTAFSISAAIGFIALFGIAAMDGIIVLSYFNRMVDQGHGPARRDPCAPASVQMRPVMMTCVAACVGLVPAAFSTGIGSQVQKPLALVVVGGMLLAPAFILLVLPVLIEVFSRRTARRTVTVAGANARTGGIAHAQRQA